MTRALGQSLAQILDAQPPQIMMISMSVRYLFVATALPPEPKNQTEARKRADAQDWINAEWLEMDTVIKTKARICVRGDLQKESESTETFAPTLRFNSLQMLMSIAVKQGYKLVQFDVKGAQAFMVSGIEDQNIFVQLPPGYEVPQGFVASLARSLYSLRDSAYRFHKTLSDWMIEYGFTTVDADCMMFKLEREGTVVIRALYVDDCPLSTDAAEVSWYLSVSITRDWEKGTLKLSQEQCIKDLLKSFNMEDCNTVLTPMEVGQHMTSEGCPEVPDKSVVKHYQQLVGTLNYLVAWSMPELAFPVLQCARYMANPSPDHVTAAKCIFNATKPNQLFAYVDADHTGDPEGSRSLSVTGYVIMMNGGAISWESKRQKVTAFSSAGLEFFAASAVGCELVFLGPGVWQTRWDSSSQALLQSLRTTSRASKCQSHQPCTIRLSHFPRTLSGCIILVLRSRDRRSRRLSGDDRSG
eukprot:3693487-Rhodomonas_salina.1